MTDFRFVDRVPLGSVKKREDGALVTDARVARTGIQVYLGSEMKFPDGVEKTRFVRVYRPGEEVFSEDSVRTLAHRPITVGHPPEMVDSSNWKKYAVGQTGDEITGEKIYLRVPMMVSDGDAVSRIESGERELSCGYICQLDWTPGTTPEGEVYDAVQRKIRYNHVAVVSRGRAGAEVRIGDDATEEWGTAPVEETVRDREGAGQMAGDNLTTVTVDGLTISTTDQGAQVIAKLQDQLTESQAALAKAHDEHKGEVAALDKQAKDRDSEIGELKAKVKKLEDEQMDTSALDARVAERAELVATARSVDKDITTEGVSDSAIRRSVVAKVHGEDFVKDASDDQIVGMFRVATKDIKPADSFVSAMQSGTGHSTADSAAETTQARDAFIKELQEAHTKPSQAVN